jgi:branched-subunit amino acid transport protein
MNTSIPRRLVAFFAGAFACRILYLAQLQGSPLGDLLFGDARVYHDRALAILSGDFIGRDAPFYSSTLYPYILAAIYAVAGARPAAALLVQVVLGMATSVLLYLLGRDLFDGRRAAVAAVLAGLYAPFLFFEGDLLMISWAVFGVTAALWAAVRCALSGRAGWAVLSGAAIGLAAADKPNLLVLAAIMPACWWATARGGARHAVGPPAGSSPGAAPSGPGAPLHPLAATGLLIAGLALVLGPVAARNIAAAGQPVLLSASAGINLYIGNHPGATGTYDEPWSTEAHATARFSDLAEASRRFAGKELGRPVSAAEADRYWRGRALEFMRGHPLATLRLVGRKVLLLLNAEEIPNRLHFAFYRWQLPALRVLPAGFWLVGPLGILGMFLPAAGAARLRPFLAGARVFLLLYGASLALLFVCDRFRLPAVPILILFAAHALVTLRDRVAAGGARGVARTVAIPVAAWLALTIIALLPLTRYDFGRDHWMLAEAAQRRGETEAALREYRAALEARPDLGAAWNNMGQLLLGQGRLDEARRAFEMGVAIAPGLAYPHKGLADTARARGDIDAAIAGYRAALAIDPQLLDAWLSLARLHYDRGDIAGARRILLEGKAAIPGAARIDEILGEIDRTGS